jgi:hypothetical protein
MLSRRGSGCLLTIVRMTAYGAQQAFSRGGARVSNAPIPVVRGTVIEPAGSTRSCRSPPVRHRPPVTQSTLKRRDLATAPSGLGWSCFVATMRF